jgi:hypothetical protein
VIVLTGINRRGIGSICGLFCAVTKRRVPVMRIMLLAERLCFIDLYSVKHTAQKHEVGLTVEGVGRA